MKNLYFRLFCCFISLLMLFIAGMVAVNCISSASIKNNIHRSTAIINEEGLYPTTFANKYGTNGFLARDQYTDCLMLNIAAAGDANEPMRSAILSPCYKGKYEIDKFPQHLTDLVDGVITPDTNYDWYWHGYLVVLKPLLLFFHYDQIRWINCLFMLLAFCFAIMQILKRLGLSYCLITIGTFLAMHFEFVPYTMQYFSVFFIAIISVAILLRWREFFDADNNDIIAFFAVGGITVFVDFLTTPIVSLGIPLLYYLICYKDKTEKEMLVKTVQLSIAWSVGYAVLWASKWGICALSFDPSVIENAMSHADKWAGNGPDFGRWYMTVGVTKKYIMLGYTFNWYWVCILGTIAVVYLYIKKRLKKANLWMLFIALYPFVWSIILVNHNYEHFGFTWRMISISMLAFTLWLYQSIIWKK